jgi:hypothetical protein
LYKHVVINLKTTLRIESKNIDMKDNKNIRITESEANSSEQLRFIKNYIDKSYNEMFNRVCILEEGKLSKYENILCDIIRLEKTTLTQYNPIRLLEFSDLCRDMITYQCKEIEFFQNRLKLIESDLMNN